MCKLSFELRGKAEGCRAPKGVAILRKRDMSDVRLANPDGRFDKRVEHGLQIEGRAADDLEHVGSRSLLLQRFPQLVNQPRILNGDDRLTGEIGDQLDLLV